jgi:hypothetical protein
MPGTAKIGLGHAARYPTADRFAISVTDVLLRYGHCFRESRCLAEEKASTMLSFPSSHLQVMDQPMSF